MNSEELEKRLWSISNAIVSFAVFQSIAFGYFLRDPNIAKHFATGNLAIYAILGALFFTFVNCSIIVAIHIISMKLRKGNSSKGIVHSNTIYFVISWGKLAFIIFFGLLSIVFIIAQNKCLQNFFLPQ